MVDTDKKIFSDYLIGCFQNYRANISDEMVEQWFRSKLFGFPLFVIGKAIEQYVDNYKNKYPPQRAQIIQLCYQYTMGKIEEKNNKLGCNRMFGDRNCGKQIFVHGYCEPCYDEIRPKNDVDKMMEKVLEDFISQAKADGCKTTREIAEWSKKKLSQYVIGKKIIEKSDGVTNSSDRIGISNFIGKAIGV